MTTTEEATERFTAALALVSGLDGDSTAYVLSGFVGAYDNLAQEHERVCTSRSIAESELRALANAVAQHEVAHSVLHAIEAGRIDSCAQLRDYLILHASFHVPDNGGMHSLLSQQKTKYAIDMLQRVLAVSPR